MRNYSDTPSDREFGEDASWKRIQQNTFTRWVNEHLKTANKQIANLETDLCDGLRLVALIEVLSGKRLLKFNKRPTFRSQKLENISVCLEFLGNDEGIKIVNIDSTDIIDCNLKLILGLIWTLILHYSITIPSWDNEEATVPSSKKRGSEPTPKQKLLTWIQSRIPDMAISNFITDWNNGKAIGALVDAIAPGLCPDWPDWEKENALQNSTEAMQLAEQYLSVPQLVKPQEMMNRNVDEQSMMTYLSQFPNAKVKPDAPLRPRTNPAKVRVYGPGIEPAGVTVGNLAHFTVETFSAGRGKVDVDVKNVDFKLEEPVQVKFNEDKNVTYTCTYTPSQKGTHLIDVKFAEKHVNKSPFKILVDEMRNDPTRVILEGPAVEGGAGGTKLKAGVPTHFKVITKDAGKGLLECSLISCCDNIEEGDSGLTTKSFPLTPATTLITIREIRDIVVSHGAGVGGAASNNYYSQHQRRSLGSIMVDNVGAVTGGNEPAGAPTMPYYLCEFTPLHPGSHKLNVTFGGKDVPASPIELIIEPSIDLNKFYVTGRGVQPKGIRSGDTVRFNVHYNNVVVANRRSSEPATRRFSPTGSSQGGDLDSTINTEEDLIDRALVKAQLISPDNLDLNLRKSVATPGAFKLTDPESYQNQNALMVFEYLPKTIGTYYLNVYYGNELLPKMPLQIEISESLKSLIKAFGPGLSGGIVNEEARFTVETNGQTGALGFAIEGPSQTKIDCKDNGDGSADVSFTPLKCGEYSIRVLCDECDIPGSPFVSTVIDPNLSLLHHVSETLIQNDRSELKKIKIYGDGIGLSTSPDVTSTAPSSSSFMKSSARKKTISPNSLIEKITICGKLQTFYVDFSSCTKLNNKHIDAKIYGSTLQPTVTIYDATHHDKIQCQSNLEFSSSRFRCEYLPQVPGRYLIYVTVYGINLPQSPLRVFVKEKQLNLEHLIKIQGSCFSTPLKLGQTCDFLVDATGTGNGELDIVIKDVQNNITVSKDLYTRKPMITMTDVASKIIKYEFKPKTIGTYIVYPLYDGQNIPTTNPHTILVEPPHQIDISKIKILDLEPRVLIGSAAEIIVDASQIETAAQTLNADRLLNFSPILQQQPPPIIKISDADENINPTINESSSQAMVLCNSPTNNNNNRSINTNSTNSSGMNDTTPIIVPVKCLIYYKETNKYYEAYVNRLNKSRQSGFYVVCFNPKDEGTYTLDFTYEDIPILPKPYEIIAKIGCDPSRVKVSGSGLSRGYLDQACDFLVDTRRAGTGGLGLTIEGPSEAKMNCRDNRDGTCSVTYLPTQPGEYDISIKFEEIHVPGSPFMSKIYERIDYSLINVYGPGLFAQNFRAGVPTKFSFDASRTGLGKIEVALMDAKTGQSCPIQPVIRKLEYLDLFRKGPSYNSPPSPQSSNGLLEGEGLNSTHHELLKSNSNSYYYNYGVVPDVPACRKALGPAGPLPFSSAGTGGQRRSANIYEITYIPPLLKDIHATVKNTSKPISYPKYLLSVKYNDLEIPEFPKTYELLPAVQPEMVQMYARSYYNFDETPVPATTDPFTYVYASLPTDLFIDTRQAGTADLDITVHDGKNRIIPGRLYPFTPSIHKIYNEIIRRNQISPSSKQSSLLSSTTYHRDRENMRFCLKALTTSNNNTSTKRLGQVGSSAFNNKAIDIIEPELLKEELERMGGDDIEGIYVYTFTPHTVGTHVIDVKFGGFPIPNSPFRVNALSIGRAEKALIYDQFPKEFMPIRINRKWEECFKVDASACMVEESSGNSAEETNNEYVGKVTCLASRQIPPELTLISMAESGSSPTNVNLVMEECSDIVDHADGTFSVFLNFQEIGLYQLETNYGGRPIPNADFKFTVVDDLNTTNEVSSERGRRICYEEESTYLKQLTSLAEYRTIEFTLPPMPVEYMTERELLANSFGFYQYENYNAFHEGIMCREEYSSKVVTSNTTLNYSKIVDSHQEQQPPSFQVPRDVQMIPSTKIIETRRKRALLSLTAEVKSPSGKVSLPKVTSNTDGTINLKYHPSEPGLHEIDIKYENEKVQGSPYQFYVDRIKDSSVTSWGPGLSYGQAGEACNFTVVTKDGQSGGLNITVEGPSKTEITSRDNKDGSVGVTYVPQRPGEYKVNVKFNDKHISGSPFTAKITGDGSKRAQLSSGSANEISLKINEQDVKKLKGSVRTPVGVEDVCLLRQLPNGNIGVSFTPHEVGVHTINITKAGEPIEGSPFKIDIKQSDLGDASKVKISGPGLKEGKTQEANFFKVDTKQAGYGGLSVSLEGPSRAEINCQDNHDGTSEFTYTVKQPGSYQLNVKFADNHVTGSPFSITVKGKGSADQRESIKKEQKGADPTAVEKPCQLTLKLQDTDPLDLTAQVTSPNGSMEECDIVNHNEGKFSIMFTPHELGMHSISVKIKGQHVQGSPFPFTVGKVVREDGTGAHKVKAYGPGLVQAEVNTLTEFNVNTHEAGPGMLGVTIEGPGKSDVRYEDLGNSCCAIEYKCTEPGEYKVNITYNDKAIPDSPHTVYITPPMGEARKITVTGLEDQISAQAAINNKPVTFTVHMNGVKGHLDARVVSPTGQEDDCNILPSGEDAYLIRFVPKVKGTHYVSVKFNHVHIRHSPFRIRVGKDIEGDPFKVQCSGKGLGKGVIRQPNEFFVNTADSGAGVMAVHIDGPGKCEVLSKEESEGYRVTWIPLLPGNYYITVKFGGHHVTGSPFKAPVEGKKPPGMSDRRESSGVVVETVTKTRSDRETVCIPKFKSDIEKVETRGMGLQKAFMNKHNTFNVNCSKAGEGFLMVGIYNKTNNNNNDFLSITGTDNNNQIIPNGDIHTDDQHFGDKDDDINGNVEFSENIQICHRGNQVYIVNYEVRKPGQYLIYVSWGGMDIPGSPFIIETFL